tara:strand:+ start:76 stop:207 length:132 start_codon:yes stop_codon:yes gene_type:complete
MIKTMFGELFFDLEQEFINRKGSIKTKSFLIRSIFINFLKIDN